MRRSFVRATFVALLVSTCAPPIVRAANQTPDLSPVVIGAPLIGKLNDVLGVTADPAKMRLALLVCPAACALSALCLWLGVRSTVFSTNKKLKTVDLTP